MPAAPRPGTAAGTTADDADGWVSAFAPTLPLDPPRRRAVRREVRPAPPPDPAPRPATRFAEIFGDEADEPEVRPRPDPAPPALAAPPPEPPTPTVRFAPAEPPAVPDEQPGRIAVPVWVQVARGIAAVLSGTVGLAAAGRSPGFAEPFWGDPAPLPEVAAGPLLAFCATGLGLFALRPALPGPARWGATLSAALLAGFAAKAAAVGVKADGFGPSLAMQVTVCLGVILAATRWAPRGAGPIRGGRLALLAGVAACGLGFPLADGALNDAPPADRTAAGVGRAVARWWVAEGAPVRSVPE